MNQIWVRPIRPEDENPFVEWAAANLKKNQFDPDILTYRQTVVLCAHKRRPVMFMPVQMASVLESLVPAPNASELERAEAIRELIHTITYLTRRLGMGEIYFVTKDPDIIKLAKRHGFEEAPGTVLRLKVNSLEDENENHPKD